MSDGALAADLKSLARAAGEATLRHYGSPETRAAVAWKGDAGPVTQADRDAHGVIVAGLPDIAPGVPVLSEEGEIPPYEARRHWTRFWLVDPLDGTKEFTNGVGEFTVNIALIDNGAPVLGVVFAPVLDLLYFAAAGGGTWRETGGAPPERVFSRERRENDGYVVVESRSHPSAELETFLSTIPVAERVKAGSSLKFCWLADGRADVYPRLGPTMEWDVAAGDIVYRESARHGRHASPFVYNKPDLRNPSFILGQ